MKKVKTTHRYMNRFSVLTLLLLAGALAPLHAQEGDYFTLTDGTLRWFFGTEAEARGVNPALFPMSYDTIGGHADSPFPVYPSGMEADDATLVTTIGEHFLALDVENAKVVTKTAFDITCVWRRTGYTGYYYQEHGDYNYYLLGEKGKLSIVKVKKGDAVEEVAYFYNWDFGAAITDITIRNGVRTKSYYWVMHDGAEWTMSNHTYQRPDDHLVLHGVESHTYFDATEDAGGNPVPRGTAAVYLPVVIEQHDRTSEFPAGKGLTGVEAMRGAEAFNLVSDRLAYGESLTIMPTVDLTGVSTVPVMPAYTKYVMERGRFGMNTNYRNRSKDLFNDGGLTDVGDRSPEDWYLTSSGWGTTEPVAVDEALSEVGRYVTLRTASGRYAALDSVVEAGHTNYTLRCKTVPPADATAILDVRVVYSNGTVQEQTFTVRLSDAVETKPMPKAKRGPVVSGMVAGGGRMADVTGNTEVSIVSCDSITAVYGGNDIAGNVLGDEGSNVTIGGAKTVDGHEVHLRYVYGGGCGKYSYQSPVNADPSAVHPYSDGTTSLSAGWTKFDGHVYKWGYLPETYTDTATWTTSTDKPVDPTAFEKASVPSIKRTSVTVGASDYVFVDSLFGGSENAFVAGSSTGLDEGIKVRMEGGTVFALFGGNNYGGAIGEDYHSLVNVQNTRLASDYRPTTAPVLPIENTYFDGYGRDFGIRYLFGGGNLVTSAYADVVIEGGMIDSCYLGGNMATVTTPTGRVDCEGDNYIFHNDAITTDAGGTVPQSVYKDGAYALLEGLETNQSAARFSHSGGRYNIRALFGGNNRAPMSSLASLTLEYGGISHVYGGGNAGDMRGAATVDDFSVASGKALEGWPYETPSAIGTYIHANTDSKIIVEKLYGGCRMANVEHSTALWLEGGVYGYVYGGNDISGDVGSSIAATQNAAGLDATHEGTYVVVDGAVVLQSVYGGSNGFYHCTEVVTVDGSKRNAYAKSQLIDRHDQIVDPYEEYLGIMPPTHRHTNLYLRGGRVLHSVYGGGVMTNVGFENSGSYTPAILTRDDNQYTNVDGVNDGTVHLFATGNAKVGSDDHFRDTYGDGNVYGGGFLSSIYGHSYTQVAGNVAIKGSLYAGNDCMGSIASFGPFTTPTKSIADYKSSNNETLNGPESDSYNSLFSTYLLIQGTPRINCVYGAGNGAYDYDGTRPEYSDREPVCDKESASNRPRQSSVYVDINTSGGFIDTVFGGGNGVGVDKDVTVLFNHSAELADATVGTIFGGNNRDNMAGCVPNIELVKGVVNNVYGGGNAGSMLKKSDKGEFIDLCGNEVKEVSTHVIVENDDVIVKESIYGGCRMADVEGMAYVEVHGTNAAGINRLYGGNDISGTINGNTRIDVSGGTINHIYGGSNGAYDYVRIADHDYSVYALPRSTGDLPIATNVYDPPFVDSTTVNLYGGIIANNVYGGGAMADCRATRVELNDRVCGTNNTLVVTGAVYGGGEGDWQHLDATRRGNVMPPATSDLSASTWVHLVHATRLGEEGSDAKSSTATVYGGGRGGDVYNTHVLSYDSWDKPFRSVFGGCWGSDVFGTAHVDLYGSNLAAAQNAFEVFGGNDYTGNVYNTELNIHSGHYGAVYGGGNGNYDYDAQPVAGATIDLPTVNTLPNSEYIVLNVLNDVEGKDVVVDSNLFGGGNMGTTWAYKKNADGEYILNSGHKVPNNDQTLATSLEDPTDYSYVITNIHGGTFYGSVFAGANGKDQPLVYGLKVVNMDGGDVKNNVYGGSQRVDDGYVIWEETTPGDYASRGTECNTAGSGEDLDARTTLRPSSILNIVGGTVRVRIYGAGYQGNTYGSTYVNLGMEAVNNSLVWTNAYQNGGHGSAANAYAIFKPGVEGSLSGSLAVSQPLVIEESVYGGANWGNNEGSFVFDAPGFFGGESRILIDGTGYNTSYADEVSTLPFFHIENNIIGTGTSVRSGDVLNRIDVLNYGGVDGTTCHASKPLHSIQRADQLFLWNTAIHYRGATDAVSAYPSQEFTINRVTSVNLRGYNVVDLDAIMTEVDSLNFYEHDLDASGHLVLTNRQELWIDDASQCATDTRVCDRLSAISPTDPDRRYSALVVNNGVNVEISSSANGFGSVNGFGYLMAENGTNAVVTARAKYAGHNVLDGGFMSTCKDLNSTILESSSIGSSLVWNTTPCSSAGGGCEYPYNNYQTSYRVWSVGQGLRTRFAVILAHAEPEKLEDFDRRIIVDDGGTQRNLAIAHARLVLPPTSPGNYYRLSSSDGIIIEDDNASMRLIDKGWQPKGWGTVNAPTTDTERETNPNGYLQTDVNGRLRTVSSDDLTEGASESDLIGLSDIMEDPSSTFGLVMASGANFLRGTGADTVNYYNPATSIYELYGGSTIINGNPHVNVTQHYTSAVVSNVVNASPVMDLYLTYSPVFSTTMLGTVYFTLDEVDAEGHILEDRPIKVAVTIATLLDNFKDMEFDLLAMYNEGRSDTYLRKAILPATLRSRDVYLQKVEWAPRKATEYSSTNLFNLTGDKASVTGNNNVFQIGIQPVDNVTTTISSAVGWYTKAVNEMVDIFTVAHDHLDGAPAENAVKPFSQTGATAPTFTNYGDPGDIVDLRGSGKGIKIGQLDGRGLSALNIQLTFDGNQVYPEDTALGHINLYFHTETGSGDEFDSDFKIRLNVMSRPHGDTIYLATADQVTRCGKTLNQKNMGNVGTETGQIALQDLGKSPENYVGTFELALNPKIYREGDVIAIMDEVEIKDGKTVTIRGLDYSAIPVIRYSGHHSELPGECGVYRGTMIHVFGQSSGGQPSSLVASSIDFDGSSVARITPTTTELTNDVAGVYKEYYSPLSVEGEKKRLDTNRVYGPIILVDGNGVVSLQNSTTVQNNYNANGSEESAGSPYLFSPDRQGAVNVGDNGTLNLMNNVDVQYNLSYAAGQVAGDERSGNDPSSGAIYVHGSGKVVLGSSHESTAVNITKNYMASSTVPYWTTYNVSGHDNPVRYIFDPSVDDELLRRNLFLVRSELTPGDVMTDNISDMIYFKTLIPQNTQIGISKWFPGPVERDTICFAYQTEGNLSFLNDAVLNGNFLSDQGYNIFYNYNVSPQTIFLHRCATFKHQIASLPLPYDNEHRLHDSVLEYHWIREVNCPIGGDTVFYSVQGGFFPYTFSWWQAPAGSAEDWTPALEDEPSSVVTTPYANSIVMDRQSHGDYEPYHASLTSYRLSPHVAIDHLNHSDRFVFRAEAKDVTGFCTLRKDITVKVKISADPNSFTEDAGKKWNDTVIANRAEATRNFQGVTITPYVWAERSSGTIIGSVKGDPTIYEYIEAIEDGGISDRHDLKDLLFCEGDIIRLKATPKSEETPFLMWDFDPYYSNPATYVVPNHNADVVAYFAPKDYWKDVVNAENFQNEHGVDVAHYDDNFIYTNPDNHSYVTTYNGDVHIYDEYGLAWLISVVNGLHGQQARPFYFNRVYIHEKSGGYDMKDHLWTPVGSLQYGFRGRIVGVSSSSPADTTPASAPVVIKNIIVNEPNLDDAGFFSLLDTARVVNLTLESALIRGNQYVGAFAARSRHSHFDKCTVKTNDAEDVGTTTILSTRYISGGLIGMSESDTVKNSTINAKFVGNAVYSGGAVGHATSTVIENSWASNTTRMNAVYLGALAGYLDGQAPVNFLSRLFRAKSGGAPSRVVNNYAFLVNDGRSQRVGGIAGHAENAIIENNYVYGTIEGSYFDGAIAATFGSHGQADHNFYAASGAKRAVGATERGAVVGRTASFRGQGNAVTLSQRVDGVDNLTRVLNLWVRQHNAPGADTYRSWRSDLDGDNSGYPVFGVPDLIPVRDTLVVEGCDRVEWQGILFDADAELSENVVDSVEMIDSTLTTFIRLHFATSTSLADSAVVGDEYEGYGFYVSASESALLRRTLDSAGYATLVLSDTLQTAFGCDSVVTLTLTFRSNGSAEDIVEVASESEVKVYPNPTTNLLNIEADGMTSVEVYDNEGRTLQKRDTYDARRVTLELAAYPAGIYYVRVHTPSHIIIQKVIKR